MASQKEKFKVRILQRDGYRCTYCGYKANAVDHVIPRAYGGNSDPDNVVAACRTCNSIANSLVFDSIEDKTIYILRRRLQLSSHPTLGRIRSGPSQPSPKSLDP